jgi:hypothetical protein
MISAKIAVPLFVAAACALPSPARADFELWSEVGASAEVLDGLRIGFDQELRLDHDATEVDRVRPGAHAAWRAARWLSLRLGYRYEIEPHYTKGADYADGWHEGYADATLRHRTDRARIALRLRYEEKRGRPWEADGELVRTRTARQRLEGEWRLARRLSLVGSGELFLALGEPDGLLDKWRAGGGLDLSLGAHLLSLLYLYERPFAAGDEPTHVVALSYHFAP